VRSSQTLGFGWSGEHGSPDPGLIDGRESLPHKLERVRDQPRLGAGCSTAKARGTAYFERFERFDAPKPFVPRTRLTRPSAELYRPVALDRATDLPDDDARFEDLLTPTSYGPNATTGTEPMSETSRTPNPIE
jgi:hypothetical protein